MRIVLAPDSFKGSLSASQVAESMARGIKCALGRQDQHRDHDQEADREVISSRKQTTVETVKKPLSDGGEGLVNVLVGATGGELLYERVTGPLGEAVDACWGVLGDGKTGVIEMAAASGLTLVPAGRRNPLLTTTYGTGELIRAALHRGCTKLIIGIGGSATNDGGMGMAQALGVKFLDAQGKNLAIGGGELVRLAKIDSSGLHPALAQQALAILVACDVDNPLTGPQGAASVYGPQKGADGEMVRTLDAALKHFARIVKRDLGMDVETQAGAGAAGGMGAGLIAFLRGQLTPGIDLVMELVELEKELAACDLVFTGEGRLDSQSVFGKVPVGVARRARSFGVPVIALAGSVTPDAEVLHREGITAYFSITNSPISLKEAMAKAAENIEQTTCEIMRCICRSIFPSGHAESFPR
ncbi:MAG TPA: glycerate kinase [Firmicutes bacterium]|nr:glycerate kinase [Bacillota bacterium]